MLMLCLLMVKLSLGRTGELLGTVKLELFSPKKSYSTFADQLARMPTRRLRLLTSRCWYYYRNGERRSCVNVGDRGIAAPDPTDATFAIEEHAIPGYTKPASHSRYPSVVNSRLHGLVKRRNENPLLVLLLLAAQSKVPSTPTTAQLIW